ncbi:MAG TPA: UDP-4-amino-4,6-dideoxy-N-acetyl-beta-L-altrosamine transaminase [Candidatus Paceibacterota bacterium]
MINKKNKKYIPVGRQTVDRGDIKAVSDVLKSDWLTQGPDVKDFEKALATYVGAKYAVAVSSGTAALHIAYLSLGLKAGDEVITTANTFVATANMLLAIGVKPIFCDIRLDTYNIDEEQIEKLITPKTKAIVPVHFAGVPCEMDRILEIARKHNLSVIEDACHALGASYHGRKIGNLSSMSIFSFHPVKSITTGEGGAVLTDNEDFYNKMLLLRSHGVFKDKNGFNVMESFGYNYRITDIQTALGLSQIKKLDRFIGKRRVVPKWYEAELKAEPGIVLPKENKNLKSAWHLYVIRVKDKKDRLPLYQYLRGENIGVNFHYPAVYSHPYYRKNGFGGVNLKNADLYSDTAITLPIFPTIARKEVVFIADKIKSYFAGKK